MPETPFPQQDLDDRISVGACRAKISRCWYPTSSRVISRQNAARISEGKRHRSKSTSSKPCFASVVANGTSKPSIEVEHHPGEKE